MRVCGVVARSDHGRGGGKAFRTRGDSHQQLSVEDRCGAVVIQLGEFEATLSLRVN